MLILTRRIGESLIVGNNVTLTIHGVKGNQVRVGVDAPHDVSVHREEIYRKIEAENATKNSVKQLDLSDIPVDYEAKFIENMEKGVYNTAKKIDLSDIAGTLTDIPAKFMDNEIRLQRPKFMENEIKLQRPVESQQENSPVPKPTPVIIRRKRRLTISTENNNDDAGNK